MNIKIKEERRVTEFFDVELENTEGFELAEKEKRAPTRGEWFYSNLQTSPMIAHGNLGANFYILRKKKTMREWLQELPEGCRERAIEQIDEDFGEYKEYPKSLSDAVHCFCAWDKTKEGYGFWSLFVLLLLMKKAHSHHYPKEEPTGEELVGKFCKVWDEIEVECVFGEVIDYCEGQTYKYETNCENYKNAKIATLEEIKKLIEN